MRKNAIAASISLLSALAAPGRPVQAITVRDDAADESYQALAARAWAAPGRVTTAPEAPIAGSGVVVGARWVLTAGHVCQAEGCEGRSVIFGGFAHSIARSHLFPADDRTRERWGGHDLALLHLEAPGITAVKPARLWAGRLRQGQRYLGVGRGRSGTGLEHDEPQPPGVWRGYQNRIDYILGADYYGLMFSDFDSPRGGGNTLASVLYYLDLAVKNQSSGRPLPLEGSVAAGDSGSGIWIRDRRRHFLMGIASFRFYSCYGGQAGYVNLRARPIRAWIKRTATGIKWGR